MTETAYWFVRLDWRVAEQSNRYTGHRRGIFLENEVALGEAQRPLVAAQAVGDFSNPFIPSDFLRPQLRMPLKPFAPDYFQTGTYDFVSRHLREAFCLPESAVQYIPVDLISGGPEAQAQEYHWMNLLACHPAIDLQRSIYTVDEGMRHTTGEIFRYIDTYERMVIRDDIAPSAELFRVAEDFTTVLAADALAERVMRSGCTGIAFEDPATARSLGSIHRYRTAAGVEEEDMNKVLGPMR